MPCGRKQIIVASSHVWGGHIKTGTEHLAEQFHADGWEVLFLSSPISPLHLFHRRSWAQSRRKLKMVRPAMAERRPGFHLLSPFTLLPHVNRFPLNSSFTLRAWHRLTLPPLEACIERLGFGEARLILFDNIVCWPMLRSHPGKKVYRLADRIDRFKVISKAMLRTQQAVFREADLVIYTARDLAKQLTDRKGPSLLLPNGVDHAFFSAPRPVPVEYQEVKSPRILYMGSVEDWFDFEQFNQATARFPDATFFVIAPESPFLQRLEKRSNVRILGHRPYASLPAYLQHADIGLIPFDMENHHELLDSVSPLKLFEYLSAGLPVISYDGREIRNLEAPVMRYSPQRPLHEAIALLLKQKEENAMFSKDTLREFASKADWKRKYEILLAELAKML